MPSVVRMPRVLAGATEATISTWLVAPGDRVAAGQPIAEIETEKALVEYAAEEDGVIGRLIVPAGDTAGIGEPIAELVADSPSRTRVFASPIVRKIASEKGVDLTAIPGTGPNGRIVRRDLEQFLAAGPSQPPSSGPRTAPPTTVSQDEPREAASVPDNSLDLIPHTPMRRAIARRLSQSKATVPHFYLVTECAVDELLALRARINETARVTVSVNDFVLMAAAAAFGDVPEANVTWRDEGLEVYRHVDLSIAVATEGGLVTPVLRGVEAMRLSGIARASADLARRARDRRLRQDELEGGVFTVSNLGMYGTLEFSAIINPPQSGILAVGAAKPQPVVSEGTGVSESTVTVATVLRCTLSVDHRAIDGALAARWLAAFTTRMEHPLGAII